jgi:hypothetical protein
MGKLTQRQERELKNAQQQFLDAKSKLDLIVELIADAHDVEVPFMIDPETLEVQAVPAESKQLS